MVEALNQSDQQTFLPDWIDTAAEEAHREAAKPCTTEIVPWVPSEPRSHWWPGLG